jgi:hypothetical protein
MATPIPDRARKYIRHITAQSGAGGHNSTYQVAAILLHGFCLPMEDAFSVIWDWNATNASPPWSEADLRHKLESFNPSGAKEAAGYLLGGRERPGESGVAAKPRAPRGPKLPPYDAGKLQQYARAVPEQVDKAWLAARSPVTVEHGVRAGLAADYLSFLYGLDEVVLIFTDFKSQGDFCFWKGKTYRLGDKKGIKAVPSELPTTAPDGIWYLANPVTGQWTIQPRGEGKFGWGRRHGACVTSWRYMVLESDEAPADLWLRALVKLPLPIVSIYSSGGRSIHALVRVGCKSKGEFDKCREMVLAILVPLGVDGGAVSGVRLTRLPGCRRGEKGEQELLFLNPKAEWGRTIEELKERKK